MARDPKAVVRRFLDDGWDPIAGRWDADVIAECFDVERYHSHTWGAGLVGVAATGRTVEVHHVEIWRVEDGRIVEHWGGIGEAAHLLSQING